MKLWKSFPICCERRANTMRYFTLTCHWYMNTNWFRFSFFFLQIYLFLRLVVKKFLAATDSWQYIFLRVRLVSSRSSSFNNGIDLALKSIFTHISVKWHFCRHFVHNTTYYYIDCYSLVYSLAEQSLLIWLYCCNSINPTIEILRKSQ